MVDTDPLAAPDVVRKEVIAAMDSGNPSRKSAAVEIVNPAADAAATPPDASAANGAPGASPFARPGTADQPAQPDPNELKPNAPADPNELKPTDNGTDPTLPPPVQVNEIQSGAGQGQSSSSATAAADDTPASDQELSSSKKKKKKGLKKLIPF